MKNKRLLAISVIIVILIIVSSVLLKQNSVKDSFSIEELKQLIEQYGEESPIVAEYLDKYKNSKELEKQIIALRNNNLLNSYRRGRSGPEGLGGENSKANSSKNKKRAGASNSSSDNQLVSDDNSELYSDYSGDEKSADESTDGNSSSDSSSYSGLQAIQEMLDNLPSRSNDFIVRLDKDVNGLEINTTGREARVSLDLLNSDLFENGAFSNAPGIWITGLSKFDDASVYKSLMGDFQERFFEVPGVGYYLLRDSMVSDSKEFTNEKIKILNDALEKFKNPDDELYQLLARTYAQEVGDVEKAVNIINKYGKDKPDYDYQVAGVYRFASENTENPDERKQYFDKAVQHYEKLRNNSDDPKIRQWSDLCLGEVYGNRGQMDKAIPILEQAYWDLPKNSSPSCEHSIAYDLGKYHLSEGNYDDALEWYDRVLHTDAFKNKHKAEVYKAKGDYDSAIRSYELVSKANKKDVYSLSQSGILHAKVGDNDQAQAAYSKIQKRLKKFTRKKQKKILKSQYYKDLKKIVQ